MSILSKIETDKIYMRRAIELARAQLGRTAPNPAVGCVLVSGGTIIAEAATDDGGRPHAEEIVLEKLQGQDLSKATAYVTLEPCHSRSHGGAGCSDRLVISRVSRVVIAQIDPHPTAKGGIAKLKAAGLNVEVGLLEDEAAELTRGFFHLLETGRPLLGISDNPKSYDAEVLLEEAETPIEAMERLGKSGMTRVYLRSDSLLIKSFEKAGLLKSGI